MRRNQHFKQTMTAIGLIALGGGVASVASAQTADESEDRVTTLDTITVTSQRREQSAQEVPLSITVLTGEDLEAFQIDEIQDAVALAPNVGFEDDGNKAEIDISIRGVTNIGGDVNSVGVYVDEFNVTPLTNVRAYDPGLYDIERIEVLRGPQGTTFGRNVLGGAIQVTTVKPDADFGGSVSAQYGSFETFKTRASVNTPLADGVYVRTSGFYETSDGFIDNISTGDPNNGYDDYGGRIALRLQPNDALTTDFSIAYRDYEVGSAGNRLPTGEATEFFSVLGVPADPFGAYADIGFFPDNNDTVNVNGPFPVTRETTIATGRIQYDFEQFSAILNTGYIDGTQTESGDADFLPQDFIEIFFETSLESYSFDGRLQARDDAPFFWSVGVLHANDEQMLDTNSLAQSDFLLALGIFTPLPFDPFLSNTQSSLEIESTAIYADTAFSLLDDKLTLGLGVRFSEDKLSGVLNEGAVFDPNIFGLTAPSLTSDSESFDAFTFRASATYAFSDSLNGYVQIAKGTKPGGLNLDPALPDQFRSFDLEELYNYEVGLKGSLFDDRFVFGAAAFYLDWNDLQFSSITLEGLDLVSATLNAAEASAYGLEVDFRARPFEGLDITGGFGLLDSEFGDGARTVDAVGLPVDISGNRLPISSDLTANLAAQYSFPVSESWTGFARGEFSWRGDYFESPREDSSVYVFDPAFPGPPSSPSPGPIGTAIDGFETVNLRAGIENDRWTLSIFGENLSEETQFTGSAIVGFGRAAIVRPRQFGIRAVANF